MVPPAVATAVLVAVMPWLEDWELRALETAATADEAAEAEDPEPAAC